uniref:Phosphoglycerate mutase n=1 Tax=Amorphochlora amoebiformis TaxID=1561963 RepID=A0A7S0DG32_9EUKA|mmetsp:Transcript_24724/g.39024  ORF Transcript_24724/g.39024 Transcript_24724/m.39024 type:complete len:230 (+) Transcript_24724:81-770(+)
MSEKKEGSAKNDTDSKEDVVFYICRHGETDWNLQRRIQGQTDTKLNKNGELQARELGKAILSLPVTYFVSSDLARAYDTGKIIAEVWVQNKRKHIPKLHSDKRLREIHAGEFQGKLSREVQFERTLALRQGKYPGGESYEELINRSRDAIFDAASKAGEGGTVLAVAHGGLIRSVAKEIMNSENKRLVAPVVTNCCMSTFRVNLKKKSISIVSLFDRMIKDKNAKDDSG